MVVCHGIEEVGISVRSCWQVDRLPLFKATLTVSNRLSPVVGRVLSMSENTKGDSDLSWRRVKAAEAVFEIVGDGS